MSAPTIDLNADLGEGVTDDAALLEVVTSANVACGFHAGDAATMRRVCDRAVERGVRIGAQVSYRDRAGFGRRDLEVDRATLRADVAEQLGVLAEVAEQSGTTVRYVKPHGALYNRAGWDDEHAGAVVDAVRAHGPLPVLGLPGTRLLAAAEQAGLTGVNEAFADRAYTAAGALVPRDVPGAVLSDQAAVVDRAVRIALTGRVASMDGVEVAAEARSLCVHGDTPGAVDLAARVRAALTAAGVRVLAFA